MILKTKLIQKNITKNMKKNNKEEIQEYLENLDKNDLLCIIKYGLRGSNAPLGVTVDDIYECIGCQYISETM